MHTQNTVFMPISILVQGAGGEGGLEGVGTVLGIEPQGFNMLGRHNTTELLPQPPKPMSVLTKMSIIRSS